jgi:trypsin-like peptidase
MNSDRNEKGLRSRVSKGRLRRRLFLCVMAAALAAGGLVIANDGHHDSGANAYERLLAQQSPALVTVRYVLKTEDEEGTAYDEDREITGVLIDPAGVVLCSDAQLAGATAPEDFDAKTSATNIKILIGDDPDGLDARILARDRELDLVWLRVKNAAGKILPALNLAASAGVHPGDRLFTIVRLAKFFDHEPIVYEGPVAGLLHKPRDLIAPGSSLGGEAGLPVFDGEGAFVGIFVAQMPEREDHQADATATCGDMDVFILPGKTVAEATKRAMEAAKE